PGPGRWLGLAICLAGVTIYFYPPLLPYDQAIGLLVVMAGVLGNAGSTLLGRRVNRAATISPLTVTVITMGISGFGLLAAGLIGPGLPSVAPTGWAIIGWLAVVNTALAFTFW